MAGHKKPLAKTFLAVLCSVAAIASVHASGAVQSLNAAGLRGTISEPVIGQTVYRMPELDMMTTGTVASSFFGTAALPFSNISTQSDWSRARAAGIDFASENCASTTCQNRLERFKELAKRDDTKFFDLMQRVNSGVNASIHYASDKAIYGKADHWAVANETVRRGRGDCEDFALLKHALLVRAGVPERSLSLVVLKDTKRKLYHAVLAVSTNKGHFILDNVINRVYLDRDMPQYQPLFSFSQNRSWLHGRSEGADREAEVAVAFKYVAPGESFATESDLRPVEFSYYDELRPTIIP